MKALILLIAIFSWFGENENLRQAKQLIAIEKFTQAIVILQPMEDIRAQYYLGWCYLKINRCSDANTHFDRFISEYSGNDLWIEEAKKNKLSCNGPTYAVGTNPDNGKDLKVKYDYKKLNDDYQIAMASFHKKDTIVEFNPVDLATVSPITNFKRVKKEVIRNSDKNTSIVSEKPSEKVIIQSPNQNPPSTAKTNPTPDVVTKTEKTPITPKPDQNQNTTPVFSTLPVADIAPKTNSQPEEKIDITVAEKKHHYKILFAIENTPDKLYMSLADVGPVSNEKASGNNYMYYIGFYPTKEKADEALQKVKAKGYGVARVMEFNKGALEMEHLEPKVQQVVSEVLDKKVNPEQKPKETLKTEQEVVESKEPEKPEEQIQEVINSDVVSYHILFRVLPNPYEKFDELKQFGPLYRETFDKNGNSRYLIGNTDDIKEAKSLLEKVKKAGYGASMVAEYVNGQLSKIVTE